MADYIETLQKKSFENLEKDLCSTYEGAVFMKRFAAGRSAISELEDKVISAIGDSNLSVAESIGFMQYMKHAIKNRSSVPQRKERE